MRDRQTPSPSETSTHAKNWFLLSAFGFAQICSWGTLYYAFPQIGLAMGAEFNWTKSEVFGALTSGLLLSAVGALPVGILIDNGHGRTVMAGGSVLAGLLCFVWSQTQSLLWFYIVFSGIGLLHAAVLYSAAFAVVAKHFEPTKVRDNITTITLWGGFASTVFIPLIEVLLLYYDWRGVLIVLGVTNITLCAGIYLSLPQPHQQTRLSSPTAQCDDPEIHSIAWAMKQPVFWALLVCFSFFAAIASSFRFHLYPLLIENGLTIEDTVFVLAVLGPAQVAGRALMKVFSNRSISSIGILATSVFPLIFIAFLVFPTNFPVLVLAGIIYGAAAGTMTIVQSMSVPEFLTKERYGTINGLMNVPINVLKALAPAIAAFAWSINDNYHSMLIGLIVSGSIMLLAFVGTVLISKTSRSASID